MNNITRWEQEDAMRGNVDLFGGRTDVVDHAAGGRQRKDILDNNQAPPVAPMCMQYVSIYTVRLVTSMVGLMGNCAIFPWAPPYLTAWVTVVPHHSCRVGG